MAFPTRPSFRSWDGTRISFQILGNRRAERTILFINGLLCTESYWVFLLEALGDDYRLVTFDLRGHQFSGPPADPENITIKSSSRDMAALMEHLGIDEAILAGFSMGVQIMFDFYGRHPERCRALVAVTGSYENPLSTFYNLSVPDRVWEAFLGTLANRLPGATNFAWHLAFRMPAVHWLATALGGTRAPKALMQGLYDHHKYVDMANGFRMTLGAVKHSARAVLPTITVPTLVIGGEKDIFTPPALSYTMRDEIPKVDFLLVKGGTHTAIIEYPELICRTVREFLERSVESSGRDTKKA